MTTAEIYDPSTGAFSPTGGMSQRRSGHTDTLLANGKVLVARGIDQGLGTLVGAAELYDPDTGTFSPTRGTPEGAGSVRRASLLHDGTVFGLIDDGRIDSSGDTAVRYDPSKGSFVPGGNRPPLFAPVMTLLSDGTVLLTGLLDPGVGVLPDDGHSADLYDPVSGGFSVTGDLITARSAHTCPAIRWHCVGLWRRPRCCSGDYAARLLRDLSFHGLGTGALLHSNAGSSQAAVLHAGTSVVVSSDDPALAGDVLEFYGADLLDGSVVPPQVSIGGHLAEVLWFGNAPGYVGLNQINVRVPSGIVSGPAVAAWLNYFDRPSNVVTIGVGKP